MTPSTICPTLRPFGPVARSKSCWTRSCLCRARTGCTRPPANQLEEPEPLERNEEGDSLASAGAGAEVQAQVTTAPRRTSWLEDERLASNTAVAKAQRYRAITDMRVIDKKYDEHVLPHVKLVEGVKVGVSSVVYKGKVIRLPGATADALWQAAVGGAGAGLASSSSSCGPG